MYQMPKLNPCPKEIKEKTPNQDRLFRGRRVLGDGLGTLRHGVLGQLTRQDQTDTIGYRVSGVLVIDGTMLTYEVWISREEMVDFLL